MAENTSFTLCIETAAGAFTQYLGTSGEGSGYRGTLFTIDFEVEALSVEGNRVHVRACESPPCSDVVYEVAAETLVPRRSSAAR